MIMISLIVSRGSVAWLAATAPVWLRLVRVGHGYHFALPRFAAFTTSPYNARLGCPFSAQPLFRPEGCGYLPRSREFSGFLKNWLKMPPPFEETGLRECGLQWPAPGKDRNHAFRLRFFEVRFKHFPSTPAHESSMNQAFVGMFSANPHPLVVR